MVGDEDQTDGAVTWAVVPDPSAADDATRHQVDGSKPFDGGEGCYYAGGTCWFTTKGDDRVWAYDAAAATIHLVYDADGPLSGVDNLTGTPGGDLFVAEDGGNMEVCLITPDGEVAPFLRVDGHDDSEITGPASARTAPGCTSPPSAARAARTRAASRSRSPARSAADRYSGGVAIASITPSISSARVRSRRGHAARRVGRAAERERPPADVDVRVVVVVLGDLGHPVHHLDGLREVRQLDGARERALVVAPGREPAEGFSLVLFTEQFGHPPMVPSPGRRRTGRLSGLTGVRCRRAERRAPKPSTVEPDPGHAGAGRRPWCARFLFSSPQGWR